MKVSMKTTNGVRALVDLAMHYEEGPVTIGCLARRLGISKYYLENLMLILKRSKLVIPSRGPNGGYSLSRQPADIGLLEALAALEGTEASVYCANCPGSCPYHSCCASRALLDFLDETVVNALSPITLESMAKWQEISLKRNLV